MNRKQFIAVIAGCLVAPFVKKKKSADELVDEIIAGIGKGANDEMAYIGEHKTSPEEISNWYSFPKDPIYPKPITAKDFYNLEANVKSLQDELKRMFSERI